ncbi:hypothetical protein WOLCODRAFT_72272, partial [Wolfiporia cocos MD-104 SS10]
PVAYKTRGKLNETRDNVMIIYHAFTGSSDVEDWRAIRCIDYGLTRGGERHFDPNRYFIFCVNIMGSPYDSASPVTSNSDTKCMEESSDMTVTA